MASGTKEDVFAALTDIENTEKIYLDNGEGGSAGVPVDLSVFIPYFKNLCERNGYPFIGTAQETQQR